MTRSIDANVTGSTEIHGDNSRKVAVTLGIDPDSILDLAMSMNPYASKSTEILKKHIDSLRFYPDSSQATKVLADYLEVDESCLLLTNGASEAIAVVCRELEVASVNECEFSLYKRHLKYVAPNHPTIMSNPNNPTGKLADDHEYSDVWDESFYPLSTGVFTRRDFERGSVVIGSLTKLFSLPGLRIGYIVFPTEEGKKSAKGNLPYWNVNSLALSAMEDLLSSMDLSRWARGIADLRDDLSSIFQTLGFNPYSSNAPYVLVPDACYLIEPLMAKGIFVRDARSFGFKDAIRVGVCSEVGLGRLNLALKEIV